MYSIDHIGILVEDLESGITKWSAAVKCRFSPIGRYRTNGYVDTPNGVAHFHDARFSVSESRTPYIELMEVSGQGSHGADRLGVHHLAIRVSNAETASSEAAELGISTTAYSRDPNGLMHICFTNPTGLNGVSLEFISDFPGPIVMDDGSPVWRDPSTQLASLWGPA